MQNLSDIKKELSEYDGEQLTFMEVCGTHTAAISENGIVNMLSPKIKLISGPGCPVCVTVASYIDRLVELSKEPGTCVVTFADMIRVRGSQSNLMEAMADGGRVRMIYSPLDILGYARKEPDIQFVFAAVGFETTTPVYAILMEEMIKAGIKNIRLLTALKTMPAVIERVCETSSGISGFLAPGHVAAVIGSEPFVPLAHKYGVPFVVAGFEGEELLAALCALVRLYNRPEVVNMYPRVVTTEGNKNAYDKVHRFFQPCDAAWRGLGIIPESGMILKDEFKEYDAGSRSLTEDFLYDKGCSCPDVITGKISPTDCPLYGKVCTPDTPKGACMVSQEGSCFNYFINKRGSL